METIGVLGLGTMGKGIAQFLAQQGYHVRAWNRTPRIAEETDGIQLVSDPSEVGIGASAIIFTMADYQATHNAIEQLALTSLPQRPILLQFGTVSPQQASQLKEQAADYGSPLLDVGMLGNHHHARSGELRLFAGGDIKDYIKIQPLLAAISKQVLHIGTIGMGMVVKLALNLLMGIEMEALAEAIAFGERYGINRQVLIEALAASGFSSPVMTYKARRLLTQHYDSPDFRLALMYKDLKLFVTASTTQGGSAPSAESSLQVLQTAMEQGLGDKDCVAVDLVLQSFVQTIVE